MVNWINNLFNQIFSLLQRGAIYSFTTVNYSSLYVVGFLCFLMALLATPPIWSKCWMAIGALLIVCAFIWQAGIKIIAIWNANTLATKVLFSLASAVLITVPYTFSLIYTQHKITAVVMTEASYFPHSNTLLTGLFFVYMALLIGSIIMFFMSIGWVIMRGVQSLPTSLYLVVRDITEKVLRVELPEAPKPSSVSEYATLIGSFLTGWVLLMGAGLFEDHSKSIDKFVVASVIALSDHYAGSECKNHPEGARIAPLKNGLVSVVTYQEPLGWEFSIVKCESRLDGQLQSTVAK